MPRQITPASSLDTLRKEAKRWLKAIRANDADARARLARAVPAAPRRRRCATCSTRSRASTVMMVGLR
jgi:hypothetical protein